MNAPQRLFEIMGGDIGKGVEFQVAAFQLGIEAGQLLGAPQDDLQNGTAQEGGGFDLPLLPGRRLARYRLLPKGEGFARRQLIAQWASLDRLSRVAGPVDSVLVFGSEPEDIFLVKAGEPQR